MEHLISFVLGILGNLIAYDVTAYHKKWCDRILNAAALRLPAEQRATRLEEWRAQLADSQGIYQRFRHALGCWIGAPAIARATSAPAAPSRARSNSYRSRKSREMAKEVAAVIWGELREAVQESLSSSDRITNQVEEFLKRDPRRLVAAIIVSAIGTVASTTWLIASLFHH